MTFLVNSPLLTPPGIGNVHILETIECPTGLTGNHTYEFTTPIIDGDAALFTSIGFLGLSSVLGGETILGTQTFADNSKGHLSWIPMNFSPVTHGNAFSVAHQVNSQSIITLCRGSQDPHYVSNVFDDGSSSHTTLSAFGFTKNAGAKFILAHFTSLAGYQTSSVTNGTLGYRDSTGSMARCDFDQASSYTNGSTIGFNASTIYGTDSAGWVVEFR